MPLYHCTECHHEWEAYGAFAGDKCAWRRARGYIIQEMTELERMVAELQPEETQH
jgi:hypothetical protein